MGTLRRPDRLTGATALAGVVSLVVSALPDPESPTGPALYLLPLFVSTVLMAFAVRRIPRVRRGPWTWLLASQLLYCVGETWFAVLALHGDESWPTPADVFYLLAYAPVAVGLLALNRQRAGGDYRGSLLDAGIIALSAATLFGVFVILPIATDSATPLLARTVSSAYPVCDVLLVFLVARLVTGPGARPPVFWLLVLGTTSTIVADVAWNVLQLVVAGNESPRWLNALWLTYYVCFAVAAAAARRPWRGGEHTATAGLTAFRLLALGVVSILPSAVLVGASLTHHRVPVGLLAAGSMALMALVVARIWDLLQRLRHQSARLESLARTDPLTGIANRRTLDHHLERVCVPGNDGRVVLALLDLDRFKTYNDTFGHQAGDELLKAATAAWTEALGGCGLLARWGGEEFVAVLRDDDPARATSRLDALRDVVPDGQTCSIGVAVWTSAEDPHATLNRADAALYRAKGEGRDRLVGPVPPSPDEDVGVVP